MLAQIRYFTNSEYCLNFSFVDENEKELIELLKNIQDLHTSSNLKMTKKVYSKEECEKMIKDEKVVFYNPEIPPDKIVIDKDFNNYIVTKDNICISSHYNSEKIKNILNKRELLKNVDLKEFKLTKEFRFLFNCIIFYYYNEDNIHYYNKNSSDILDTIKESEIFGKNFDGKNLSIIKFILKNMEDKIKDKIGIRGIFEKSIYSPSKNEEINNKNILKFAYDKISDELSEKFRYFDDIDIDFSFITNQFLDDIKLTIWLFNELDLNNNEEFISFVNSIEINKCYALDDNYKYFDKL